MEKLCATCYFHARPHGGDPCSKCPGSKSEGSFWVPCSVGPTDDFVEIRRALCQIVEACRRPRVSDREKWERAMADARKRQVAVLTDERDRLKDENATIRAKNAELQNENEALSAELVRLKEELDGLKQDPKILRIGQDLHDEVFRQIRESLKVGPITFAPPEETMELAEASKDAIHERDLRIRYLMGQLEVYREFMVRTQCWDVADRDEGG